MRITGLDHIVITTANIDKCIAFYAGVLGLRHELKNGKHAFYFGVQKINIHCRPAEFLPTAQHPTYGSQDICLLADRDICTIKAEIEAKGYPIEEGVVARQGALGAMQREIAERQFAAGHIEAENGDRFAFTLHFDPLAGEFVELLAVFLDR